MVFFDNTTTTVEASNGNAFEPMEEDEEENVQNVAFIGSTSSSDGGCEDEAAQRGYSHHHHHHAPSELKSRLFIDSKEAAELGTTTFPEPVFDIYESDTLLTAGLCGSVKDKLYPKYLPRPYAINSVQADAVRRLLVQYYKHKRWRHNMTEEELVMCSFNKKKARKLKENRYGGGMVIGDGTGIGKTREMASFLVSVVLAEQEMQNCVNSKYMHLIPERDCWSTLRRPFFIWLTCSRTLFIDCQSDALGILVNPDQEKTSWARRGFTDSPQYYNIFDSGLGGSGSVNNNYGINTTDHNGETIKLRFVNLLDIKAHMKEKDVSQVINYMTLTPTVLFMTYDDLNCNLSILLKLLFGDYENNFSEPDSFLTALLCDEFHTPNNISDTFRGFLEGVWYEEDMRHQENRYRHQRPVVIDTIKRLKYSFDKKRKNNASDRKAAYVSREYSSSSSSISATEKFLGTLSRADSFRLLVELLKYDTFFLMASATPFKGNDDLHPIDHIIRGVVPAYTSSCMALRGAGKSNPSAIADASEYSTVFLEDIVKLLGNRGYFVSRSISLENVESSVVNCAITPLQKFAMDELSAYFMEMKKLLSDVIGIGKALRSLLSSLPPPLTESSVKAIIKQINEGKVIGHHLIEKIDHRMKVVVLKDTDSSSSDPDITIPFLIQGLMAGDTSQQHKTNNKRGKKTSIKDLGEKEVSEHIEEEEVVVPEEKEEEECVSFVDKLLSGAGLLPEKSTAVVSSSSSNNYCSAPIINEVLSKKLTQYKASMACKAVTACKAALLSIKSRSIPDIVKRLRKSKIDKKAVMSLEQTGDSFLSDLASRLLYGQSSSTYGSNSSRKKAKKTTTDKNYKIFDINPYESSPLASNVMNGYAEVCVAMALGTLTRITGTENGTGEDLYVLVVPRPPPIEPLMSLSGNSIDVIEQSVGESKHAEISNRKYISRFSDNGLMMIRSNSKTSNTAKCISNFNNSPEVDVMLLGPKGSTGHSLHDSKKNKCNARRVHFIIDLPYNAISYRQTIGRTHRNGQLTSPIYLILSSDSPAERRFFDSLEARVKDSQAGSFADRYSNNTVRVASSAGLEQFLDKQLVLKTMGMMIKMLTGDMNLIEIFIALSKMTIKMGDRGGFYAFVEGLDVTNGYFLNIVLLGLHVSLVLIGKREYIKDEEDRSRAESLAGVLSIDINTMKSLANAMGKVLFSNLCLKLSGIKNTIPAACHVSGGGKEPLDTYECKMLAIMNREDAPRATSSSSSSSINDTLVQKIAESANVLIKSALSSPSCTFAANGIGYDNNNNSLFDVPDEEGEEKGFDRDAFLASISRHNPLYSPLPKDVFTVRVLGGGRRENVISHGDIPGFVVSESMVTSISTVAATSVITILCKEDPRLIYNLEMSSALLRQFTYPHHYSSYAQRLAKRLTGTMTYKQFQNEYFAAKRESELMRDLFISTRAVMARDDRLEGVCRNRKNVVMGASYLSIRVSPATVKRSRGVKQSVILDYTEEEEEEQVKEQSIAIDTALQEEQQEEEGEEGGEEMIKGHLKVTTDSAAATMFKTDDKIMSNNYDLDIVLATGEKLQLTPQNSIFVSEHIDVFVYTHMCMTDDKFLQLSFDNYKYYGLPMFCLYNPGLTTKNQTEEE
nr:MAG: wsv026-like protein [Hemigrapsus takanoi nimavirus]